MAVKTWQTIKVHYCEHAGCDVKFEAETVFPSEHMPDLMPRIFAHRCSHAMQCNLFNQPACIWAGTNPLVDPFKEKG